MRARFFVSALAFLTFVPTVAYAPPPPIPHRREYIDMRLPPIVIRQRLPLNPSDPGAQTIFDRPIMVNGTEVVCTGIGKDSRADPRWAAYPLRLEVAAHDGHYLGEERVTLGGNGISVRVRCKGPWILMRVPAGSYAVQIEIARHGARNVTVNVPANGQRRAVIHF